MELIIDRLPTVDNLSKRNIQLNDEEKKGVFCLELEESAGHVFLSCKETDRKSVV